MRKMDPPSMERIDTYTHTYIHRCIHTYTKHNMHTSSSLQARNHSKRSQGYSDKQDLAPAHFPAEKARQQHSHDAPKHVSSELGVLPHPKVSGDQFKTYSDRQDRQGNGHKSAPFHDVPAVSHHRVNGGKDAYRLAKKGGNEPLWSGPEDTFSVGRVSQNGGKV